VCNRLRKGRTAVDSVSRGIMPESKDSRCVHNFSIKHDTAVYRSIANSNSPSKAPSIISHPPTMQNHKSNSPSHFSYIFYRFLHTLKRASPLPNRLIHNLCFPIILTLSHQHLSLQGKEMGRGYLQHVHGNFALPTR